MATITPVQLAKSIRDMNHLPKDKVRAEVHSDDYYLNKGDHEGYSEIHVAAGVDVGSLKLPEGFRYETGQLVKRQKGGGTYTFKVVKDKT